MTEECQKNCYGPSVLEKNRIFWHWTSSLVLSTRTRVLPIGAISRADKNGLFAAPPEKLGIPHGCERPGGTFSIVPSSTNRKVDFFPFEYLWPPEFAYRATKKKVFRRDHRSILLFRGFLWGASGRKREREKALKSPLKKIREMTMRARRQH